MGTESTDVTEGLSCSEPPVTTGALPAARVCVPLREAEASGHCILEA